MVKIFCLSLIVLFSFLPLAQEKTLAEALGYRRILAQNFPLSQENFYREVFQAEE